MLRGASVLLHSALVVTPSGVADGGWVLVRGGRIAAIGSGAEPGGWPPDAEAVDRADRVDLRRRYLLPGFIDLHVHGGGGATFDEGAESVRTGLAVHRAHGTTRSLVSLVTGTVPDMTAATAAAATVARADPGVLGLHLEGPFLSPARRGVHDPAKLLAPDPAVLHGLLDAGDGQVRVVTVAPELPGGLSMVRQLVHAGVHAAVGHSDAGYDVARQAFDAGADLVTHAFNGMRPMHHRDPAIVGAAMDAGVVLEVINDGVHLHDATVRLLHAVAPGRLALITDAMGAAGAADGMYRLGSFEVRVSGGVARLAGGDSIAGSTLTLDVAVRRAVSDVGLDLVDAVNAASLVPARFLGVDAEFGSIAPGRAADLVIADAGLSVQAVMAGGAWVDSRRP